MTSCEEKMFTEVVFKIIYEMFYEDDVMKLEDDAFCRDHPDKVMAIIDEILREEDDPAELVLCYSYFYRNYHKEALKIWKILDKLPQRKTPLRYGLHLKKIGS